MHEPPDSTLPGSLSKRSGLRPATLLRDFSVPARNATLRALADVLNTLVSEAAYALPKPLEGWYR
jgi:hypothetical protein